MSVEILVILEREAIYDISPYGIKFLPSRKVNIAPFPWDQSRDARRYIIYSSKLTGYRGRKIGLTCRSFRGSFNKTKNKTYTKEFSICEAGRPLISESY